MSFHKTAQVFPVINQEKIAQFISKTLRDEYGGLGSARKRIGRKINIDHRTVKNWYEGSSAPNLTHFIALSRSSHMFVEWFLKLCGHRDLAEILMVKMEASTPENQQPEFTFYSIKYETIGSKKHLKDLQNLNQRQIWFYFKLREGHKVSFNDIVSFWGCGRATAKRDIAKLSASGLVSFRGPRKNGRYIAHPEEDSS